MPISKVRYAVVGLGNIAQVAVLPAFQHARENSELCALVSGDPEKLAELGERYRVPVTGSYSELESVLGRSGADAVYLAVPNRQHRLFTERAARARVHVLCEKPMAVTEDDCLAMIHACDLQRVKLMIAYRLHFEAANLEAIELVRSGRLGSARYLTSAFSQEVRPGDIRTKAELGGGALYDLGVYCINAARYLFRAEPESVLGATVMGTDPRFRDVDEATTAILRFSDGRTASFTVSQGAADVSSYRVVGTRGDLRVEPAYDYVGELAHHLTLDGKTRELRFARRDQFASELVYFSRCVLENREPEPSGWEGLADVRVIRAILDSARTGREVALGPFERHVRPDRSQEIAKPPVRKPPTVHAPPPTLR